VFLPVFSINLPLSPLYLHSCIFPYLPPISQYLAWISHPRSPCVSLGSPFIFSESPCISLGCLCLDFLSSPMNLFVSPIHLNIFSQNLPVFPSDLPRSLCISPGSLYPQSLIFLYLPVSPSTFTISPMDLASQISLKIFVYLLRISIYFLKISLCFLGILLDEFVSSLDLPSRIFKYFLSISLYLPFVSNPVSSYIPLCLLPLYLQ
jgi:hypothetical protein